MRIPHTSFRDLTCMGGLKTKKKKEHEDIRHSELGMKQGTSKGHCRMISADV